MEVPPQTRYVDRDGKALAYQVFGEGPANVVAALDAASHLELMWTDPGYTRLMMRHAANARLAIFERLGFGLSDPLNEIRPIEDQANDLFAIMDAAGMSRAVVAAVTSSSPGVLVAAARSPHRVVGLCLISPVVQGWLSAPPDELDGWTEDSLSTLVTLGEEAMSQWGSGRSLEVFARGLVSPRNTRLWGLMERASVSPGTARSLWTTMATTDVRAVLPVISVPTIVLRNADSLLPESVVRATAEMIPGAEYRETPAGRPDMTIDEFWSPVVDVCLELAGIGSPRTDPRRRLATILFTDIVGSTERAARLGDAEWRAQLERHDEAVRRAVGDGDGRVVKHLGDGALSVFDGPAQAIRTAETLLSDARQLGFELRAGIHAGECEIVGDDLAGMAVHIGARVSAAARPGEILVSRTVHDLVVGSGITLASRGEHELKGVPGAWELFAVSNERAGPLTLEPERKALRPSDRMILAGARRAPGLMRRVNGLLTRRR